MITLLQNLKASTAPSEKDFGIRAGAVSSVHAEIAPGVFVHVSLSQDGLMFRQGESKIGVPMVELLALAASCEKIVQPIPEATSPGIHDSHFVNK